MPQLYLIAAAGDSTRRLVGFQRVELAPQASTTVQLTLDPRLLAHWDSAAHRWQIDPGSYEFALGHSAEELGTPAAIQLPRQLLAP